MSSRKSLAQALFSARILIALIELLPDRIVPTERIGAAGGTDHRFVRARALKLFTPDAMLGRYCDVYRDAAADSA